MRNHDVAGDGQTQAHALRKAAQGLTTEEWLEDASLIDRGHAGAGILHVNGYTSPIDFYCDRDLPTGWCLFDRVAHQILDRLSQPIGIRR